MISYKGEKYYACLFSNRYYYRGFGTLGSKLLHRVIWEEANGPIPEGHHVHHINNDSTDNRIENLELHSKADHFLKHHTPAVSGSLGGKSGKGKAKARPTEIARQNALKGWTPEARASRLNGTRPKKRK